MNNLEALQKLIDELKSTNSANDKKEILKKYSECKQLLFYTYNSFFNYYVTSDVLKKRDIVADQSTDISNITTLLDKLRNREVTGHAATGLVNRFIKENIQYKELIYKIIDRDLEIRIGIKGINDVFENLIPEFSVALANKYRDYANKVNLIRDDWRASRKLDGCRCIAVIDENQNVRFYSRQGKEFLTLGILRTDIEGLSLKNIVLDGEICLVDSQGNENFQDVMKQITKKEHTIQNPRYKVFDILTTEEFYSKKSKLILTERLSRIDFCDVCIEKLQQRRVVSQEELNTLTEEAISNGWEGLILRKNTFYEGKRTNNMLKVKQMHDAEYKVLDLELGEMDDGHGNKIKVLSNIIIEHKGNKVGVGSGFTIEERVRFYNNPAEILNKEVTIQYFAESLNQKGEYSLRFPVIKVIHGDKREV